MFLVEGGSDVAACLTVGLCVVGRPSNVGGLAYLTQLLRPIRDRRIVVVGERDKKPDGRYPGKDGGTRTWERLRDRLARRVEWRMPPGKAKDMRAWVQGLDIDVTDTAAAFAEGKGVYQ